MDHRERLIACTSGERTDRPPVAFWRHFPVDDQTPDGLAAATINFQQTYDFDLIKITPASSFCIKDYGVLDAWHGSPEGTRDYTKRIIHEPGDWRKLVKLDPRQGVLGDQIKCIRQIMDWNKSRVPTIQTIFSPLAQAKNLIGQEKLLTHMRIYPEEVKYGLAVLTETTLDYINELKSLDIDGIFFAIQFGQSHLLSLPEYDIFEVSYDHQVLASTKDLWINMVHLHGENIYFDRILDLPVQIINWHDRHTPPSLDAGMNKFPGAVCGGLRRWETMVLGTPNVVTDEALDAIKSTDGHRMILGSGCVLPVITPSANIKAARKAVETEPY